MLKKAGWQQTGIWNFSLKVGKYQKVILILASVKENKVSIKWERITHYEKPLGPTFLYDDSKIKRYIFSVRKEAYEFVKEYIAMVDLAKYAGAIPAPGKKWEKNRVK